MNSLTPRQLQALACGLSAFDQACVDRTRRRRMRRGAGVFGAAVGIAVAMYAASQPRTTRLPAYVRMMTSDAQVAAELELANACERIERAKGRVVVVECALPPLVPDDQVVPGGRAALPAMR